jgi:hypothetical protein
MKMCCCPPQPVSGLPWKALLAPGANGIAPGAGHTPVDPEWQPL